MTRHGWAAMFVAGGMAAVVGVLLCKVGLATLWALFLGLNVATMVCYGYDKYQAATGGWRLPEVVLHAMATVGGTPGAFAGQMLFRHKTRDVRFRRVFWCIVAVQLLALLWFRHAWTRSAGSAWTTLSS